jgi:hypothetical protein
MDTEALLSNVEAKRKARASGLRVAIVSMNPLDKTYQGRVLSSTGATWYEVRLNLSGRRCRCSCEDFQRNLRPCKHLAAFAKVLRDTQTGVVA